VQLLLHCYILAELWEPASFLQVGYLNFFTGVNVADDHTPPTSAEVKSGGVK
jgi:hypothetical protein